MSTLSYLVRYSKTLPLTGRVAQNKRIVITLSSSQMVYERAVGGATRHPLSTSATLFARVATGARACGLW
jgi:hypothetical protein